MGCICVTSNTTVEYDNPANEPSEVSYPVPFGHVPYTPSLPGAMGPIWDVPTEWWYYVGWATDGTKQYTILMETLRFGEIAALLYGIGIDTGGIDRAGFFATQCAIGSGKFPIPTPNSWSTSLQTTLPIQSTMDCKLISGVLGLSGAVYELSMKDVTNGIEAKFVVKDTLGMVFEGASGAFHKAGGGNSYEYAAPCLTIQEGSSITTKGEDPCDLVAGNLWLDRQTIGGSIGDSFHEFAKSSFSGDLEPLYTGNWLAVHMNDKTIYNIVFKWPEKSKQWIVGTKVEPPVYPTKKIGLEYPPLSTWDEESPVQGLNVLKSTEFDLNILQPDDPSKSPHWTSPTSGNTYCSAWLLRIREKVYTITVLVPNSEVFLGTYFFEGSAIMTDENGCEVGKVFVEQMGYN